MTFRSEENRVCVSRVIPAPRSLVWDVIVNADHRERWWPGFDFDARVGGPLDESWQDGGGAVRHTSVSILKIDSEKTLKFERVDRGWSRPSVVLLQLQELTGLIKVTVTESGLAVATSDPGLVAQHQQGWERHLSALDKYLRQWQSDHGRADAPQQANGRGAISA